MLFTPLFTLSFILLFTPLFISSFTLIIHPALYPRPSPTTNICLLSFTRLNSNTSKNVLGDCTYLLQSIHLAQQCQFGLVDCFQLPQTYKKNYKYAVCIPQKNMVPTLNIAWFTLTSVDFILPLGSVYLVGTLEEAKVKAFEELLQQLCSYYHPLHNQPLQHELLDIYALLEYIEILYLLLLSPCSKPVHANPTWMGCFMKDTATCKALYFAGVPVWLVCTEAYISPDMNIKEPVRLVCPEDIVKAMYLEKGISKPFPLIYHGPGSLLCHIHTCRDYEGTFMEKPEPMQESFATSLSNPSSSTGKQSTKKQTRAAREQATTGPSRASHPKQSGGGDLVRWEEPDLPEIPKPHSLFALAWRKASKNMSRVKLGIVDPGYHFLKPTLCGGTSSMVLTQSASTKLAVWAMLGDIIQVAHDDPVHMSEEIEWRGMQVQALSLSDPPLHFTCSLLWELYELNFHYELHTLNPALVPQLWLDSLDKYTCQSLLWSIFPGECGLSSWSVPLPQEPHDLGLTASEMEVAFPYLNKFCQLLSAWPGVPFCLKSPIKLDGSGNQAASEAFILACKFYIQTAFDYLGHQPSLPCIFTFV
ncbi:hypothetical protein F5J12DRAFT_784550 [Pisolithus orientalis]|uniref:uncharacterized protein n=1 Tax=Pisolithus orientalis TaxID=936130 RepID=UPI0022247CF8|nr:uncharacterized protein F5J12DRAFT_784550 [Pisolithus orientalis]KAI5999772.1 hypothetical protein F5J12DRAFT_784550 [Pisolithus orientalis]